jgi:hypothetical protein
MNILMAVAAALVPSVALAAAPVDTVAAPTLGEAGLLGLATVLPLLGAWGLKRRLPRS